LLLPLSDLSRGIECFEAKLIIPRDELPLFSKENKEPCPPAPYNREQRSEFLITRGEPVRGFLNDTTSHLLKELIIKWAKFVNNSKSYKFGAMPAII